MDLLCIQFDTDIHYFQNIKCNYFAHPQFLDHYKFYKNLNEIGNLLFKRMDITYLKIRSEIRIIP